MTSSHVLSITRSFTTREQFLKLVHVPQEAVAHGIGTDIEADLPLVWAITALLRPAVTVELGTRQAVSTRTLAHAIRPDGVLVAIDPDPGCAAYLCGVHCRFLAERGEEVFGRLTDEQKHERANLLFIDTDPHTYDQTRLWLRTWVEHMLAPGGAALFHDVVPARPEIQVAEAVRDWVSGRKGWRWVEFEPPHGDYAVWQGGLGLLWAPAPAAAVYSLTRPGLAVLGGQ